MNSERFVFLVGAIIAWILMAFVLFTGGRMTGDMGKAMTYGLSVANATIASYNCKMHWKK